MTELYAFLTARKRLPNPDTYDTDIMIVTVGDRPMPNYTHLHIQADFAHYVFVFNKVQSRNTSRKYEWICDNRIMQSIIDETHTFATETVLNIMLNIT